MGRSYWFECSRCGYRAKVSGGSDRGLNFMVQTIACRDCHQLYDAVTRLRVPDERGLIGSAPVGLCRIKPLVPPQKLRRAPTFQAVLNRLLYLGATRFKWLRFKLECPVSSSHQVQPWNEPAACPKCGLPLDKHALPYRIWD
jgi:hypothetical protein